MHVKASGGLAGRVAGGWLEVPGMGGGGWDGTHFLRED